MSLDALTQKSPVDFTADQPRSRRKRSLAWLLPVGLFLGFLLVLILLFGDRLRPALVVETVPVVTLRSAEESSPNEQPTRSADARDQGKGSLLFQASGWVEPDPYPVFVPTLTNGVVSEVHALEGQAVRKGDLLATLIDEDAQLDLLEAQRRYLSHEKKIAAHCAGFDVLKARMTVAQRRVEVIKTRLAEARDIFNRLSELSAGAVSRQEVVQARLATGRETAVLAEAEAEIPGLEAQMAQLVSEKESMLAGLDELETARDRARLKLDRTKITAPMDGTVLSLHVAPGMKRMQDGESPKSAVIVELYDPRKLQARIDVPLNEAAVLRPGLAVELVSELLPDTSFSGTVTRVTGQADLQRNTLQAKVAIDNPDARLRPEMLVRAKFFAPATTSAGSTGSTSGRYSIYVLETAIVNDSLVWVVAPDSTARKREITLADEVRDKHRLVLEGLRSGERVILPPHDQLKEGLPVKSANPESPE